MPTLSTGRLEIRAEESFLQTLEKLANESGTSKATVIDRAVGLYKKALEEAEKGRVIRFVDHQQSSDASIDRLLDAAHEIIPREARYLAAGERNGRQVLILEALLRAAAATARGIADNTQEDRSPLVGSVARDLKDLTDAITTAITDASNPQHGNTWGAPANAQGFGMPSMSGEELV